MGNSSVRWGIVGTGNVADKFASDLSMVVNAKLVAVASRSPEKAALFAEKHQADKAYASYDALFLDPEIDIVYIATPHNTHCELSIRAMLLQKHVLCEKPLAINLKEAQQIIQTSKTEQKFFMEALWTRFNPCFIDIKQRIERGDLGQIKYINADFSFNADSPLDSRIYNVGLGGGAILDIGIYPAFLAYSLLGIPVDILASSITHPIANSDVQSSMIFRYKEAQALLYSGLVSKSEMRVSISGTKGQIYLDDGWHAAESYVLVRDNRVEQIEIPRTGLGYVHEIMECHYCLKNNLLESTLWSHQHSLDLIGMLDLARKKAGICYPQD
ncbi:Gfo/Idh/MocA family oxidoreductase [Flavobacteriaceae bacterium F08102]|nr:Gfo/Idh/MocA family oxidoreductase [Flavobacteriaceae bacterium F08102]